MQESATHNKRDLITKAKSSQFVVVIVASIVVSASLIGIKILWEQRSYQAEIISAKTTARNQLEANIEAVEQLKIEFADLEKSDVTSSLVLDALPSKYDFPALATSIEKISTLSGVGLESFVGDDLTASVVNSDGQPVPVEIPFTVSITGSYETIQKFIENMQKSIRPFQIKEMKLEASDNGIQANIRMSTYYMPGTSLDIRKQSIVSGSAATVLVDPANPNATVAPTTDLPPGVDASGVPQ